MKILSELLSLFDSSVELEEAEELIVDQKVQSISFCGDDVVITLSERQPVAYGHSVNLIVLRKKKESYLDPWVERVSQYLVNLDLDKIDLAFLFAYIVRKGKGKDTLSQKYLSEILVLLGWQQDEKEPNIFLRPAKTAAPRTKKIC